MPESRPPVEENPWAEEREESALLRLDIMLAVEAKGSFSQAGFHTADTVRLNCHAKDPLEKIWEGELLVPGVNAAPARGFTTRVGGEGYGGF